MCKSSGHTRKAKEFDDVFQHVNSFSWYQSLVYNGTNILCVIPMNLAWMNLLFAMGTPHFHCDVTNTTCPPNQCCDNCTSYSFDGPFTSTASEWNLICENAPVGAMLQMMFFLGMLVGSVVAGSISDAVGRKITIYGFFAVMGIAQLGSSFANSVTLFAFLEFVVGVGLVGTVLTQYTLNMEILGPSWRTLGGNLNEFYWLIGAFLATLIAYLTRDWRLLVLVSSVPTVFVFLVYRWIPRSPRWLVAHGRIDEAVDVLVKFGGKNKKPADRVALWAILDDVRTHQMVEEKEVKRKKYTPLDLVRTPKMRKLIFLLCYNWFVVNVVNNGMYLFISSLAGDMYINVTILNLASFVIFPVVWFVQNRAGRRFTNGILMLLGAVSCFVIVAVPDDKPIITTVFALSGAAMTYGGYATTYLLISELFPTVIRNTALGCGSMAARLGGIVAPYMAMMGHLPGVTMSLPMGIFGALTLLAAIATYWIPETLFASMHQTIEEAEQAEDYYGMPCCGRPPPRHRVEVEVQSDSEINTRF